MIKPDGSYQLKNGKQAHLREGQYMDMHGRKFNSERMFRRNIQGDHGMGRQERNMRSGVHHQNMNGGSGGHH